MHLAVVVSSFLLFAVCKALLAGFPSTAMSSAYKSLPDTFSPQPAPTAPTASFIPPFQGAPTAGPILPPADPDAEPSNIPQMLAQLPKMNATIEKAAQGNVTITLINTESGTLYLDPDFSFLSPGVESLVLNLTNAQGAKLSADDNYEARDADSVSPTSLNDLTAVAAGQSLSRSLNMSEIFVIPETASYTVISPFLF